MTLFFNLSTPNRERSFSCHGQYICEVSLLCAKNKWIYHVETIQSLKTKYDHALWSFDPKIKRGHSQGGQYICEVSLLYAKIKWSCVAETVKKFKFQIWPLTFWPKSVEVILRSRSTYMWSIMIVCQME